MKLARKHITKTLGLAVLTAALAAAGAARADEYADVNQLLRSGKLTEALTKADQYLAGKPKDPQMRFIKGVVLTEAGRTNEAIATFQKLTEDYPELPEPYNNLAVLYAGQAQYDKARAALEMAIRTNPSYATAHENLGDVYAKLASQAYTRALRGRQALRSWYMAAFNLPFLPEKAAETGLMARMLRSTGMTKADVARFRTEILEYGALPGALGYYRALPLSLAGLNEDLTVNVPTTMVWSDGDTAIDRAGPEQTDKYCCAAYDYVELSGVSHWIPTQAPREAADAILARIGHGQ